MTAKLKVVYLSTQQVENVKDAEATTQLAQKTKDQQINTTQKIQMNKGKKFNQKNKLMKIWKLINKKIDQKEMFLN